MRLITTTLSGLLLSALSAQVTIDFADFDPNGIQMNMYLMTAPASTPELSDGFNQTWDLSTITLQPIGTLAATPAEGTPYAATYPSANWAWGQTVTGLGTAYTYLDITTTAVNILARNVPTATNNFTDPEQIMKFPLAYGESFSDTYVDNTGTSLIAWVYSGHGTAITPLGNFTDVVKLESSQGDLLLWNTSPLYPILIDDGNSVLLFNQTNAGITEQALSALNTYPNPCHDRLTLSDALPGSAWHILDTQGRLLVQGTLDASKADLQVDVAGLAAGSYLLLLNEGEHMRRATFVKE